MKLRHAFLFILVTVLGRHADAQTIVYVSPVPGSHFNSRETNIILKCSTDVDRATVSDDAIALSGSISGLHTGTMVLSDDQRTMVFLPSVPFAPSEEVTADFAGSVKTTDGIALDAKRFTFTVTPQVRPLYERYRVTESGEAAEREQRSTVKQRVANAVSSDSLPPDFPSFSLIKSDHPSEGYYFMSTANEVPGIGYFLMMIDTDGTIAKYKRTAHDTYDFKMQPNGRLTYAEAGEPWNYAGGYRTVHYVMDTNFTVIDSFKAGNGYDADTHEFQMLSNGHVLLHAYDIQYMDLSSVVPNGNPNAIVVGSVLQELDLQKNVVFQWRSWDYVPIGQTYMNVSSSSFDYVHVNAYQVDTDGNILACFRTIWSVLKINRTTGEIMWHLGGKANDFTFVNENEANAPGYFTFPHSLKKLESGNIMLFDNGNNHTPKYSRAVEYALDEVNKTATLVWEYRHTPDVYGPNQGSVQRLANGNTVIGWGSANSAGVGKTAVTEVRPDKSTVFELEWVEPLTSYRAQKFFPGSHPLPAAEVKEAEVLEGNSYSFNAGDSIRTGVSVKFVSVTSGYNMVTVKRFSGAPVNLDFPERAPFVQPLRIVVQQTGISSMTADVTFDSTLLSRYSHPEQAVIYLREFEGTGMFIPLTTVYSAASKTLTATTTKFGEFIIGVPEGSSLPPKPNLETPVNNGRVNQSKPVFMRWSTFGHITGSHLQIANDSSFTAIVLDDSSLSSSYLQWNGFDQNTKYYWRAKVMNEQGTSDWSASGRFTTSQIYFTAVYPAANENLLQNSSYVVKYENNLSEWVAIRLYRSGNRVLSLKDSSENTGRFVWKVPVSVVPDSTYTIRISSVLDSTLFAETAAFSVSSVTNVKAAGGRPEWYSLSQNFPNPFNPNTVIKYQLAANGYVSLKVYDLVGREIAVLANGMQEAGEHSVQWNAGQLPSGIYFYRLQSEKFVSTKKLLLLK